MYDAGLKGKANMDALNARLVLCPACDSQPELRWNKSIGCCYGYWEIRHHCLHLDKEMVCPTIPGTSDPLTAIRVWNEHFVPKVREMLG